MEEGVIWKDNMNIYVNWLLIVGHALEEPQALNDSERNDEVAQAQLRAKWLACLIIAQEVVTQHNHQIDLIALEQTLNRSLIVRKTAANVLSECTGNIHLQDAQEVLQGQGLTAKARQFTDCLARAEGGTLELNQAQLELRGALEQVKGI